MWIFAYGSLMCPQSCERTLKRTVSYQKATLNGYQRTFSAKGSAFSEQLKTSASVRYANLQKNENTFCEGLIFKITKDELFLLKQRETDYDLIEVSEILENKEKVFTFLSEKTDYTGFILQRYLMIMINASHAYPDLREQLEKEIAQVKHEEILSGGYIGVTGYYSKEL